MDIFATILSATNTQLPDDRTLDGRDLLPMLTSDAASPHDVIFGQLGAKLSTIRDARWKLHILAPGRMALRAEADGTWRDPRAPDGVTILAPFEQYNLDSPPGPATGVRSVSGASLRRYHVCCGVSRMQPYPNDSSRCAIAGLSRPNVFTRTT